MDQDKLRSFRKMSKTIKKLNTKELCFLCLQTVVQVKREAIIDIHEGKSEYEDSTSKPVSLRSLQRHFTINLDNPTRDELEAPNEIEANLCQICKKLVTRYSALIQQLEKVQLEMDYYQERIQLRISEATNDPELFQNYSKMMTSDAAALSQLAAVDKLRKEICMKSSQKQTEKPIVKLIKVDINEFLTPKLIKNEVEECELDILSEGVPSPVPSLMSPSPNLTPDPIKNIEVEKVQPQKDKTMYFSKNPETGKCRCSQCGKEFSHSKSANRHYKRIHLKERFKFGSYTKTYQLGSDGEAAPRLKKTINYFKNSQTGRYQCIKCDKSYRKSSNTTKHFKEAHLDLKYTCDICKTKTCSRLRDLARHKKICQRRIAKRSAKEKDPTFKFICEFCGERFDSQRKLTLHRKVVHLNVDRYPCDLCDKKFKRKSALMTHKESAHLGKTFRCRFCNKECKWKRNALWHEKKCKLKVQIKDELKD